MNVGVKKGYKQTEEHKLKRGIFNKAEHSFSWKGNEVKYRGLHTWVERELGTPSKCEECNTEEAKKFEWANVSGNYLREVSDWKRLCASCHARFDNKVKNIYANRNN